MVKTAMKFRDLTPEERLSILNNQYGARIESQGETCAFLDKCSENVVAVNSLPLSFIEKFVVNDKAYSLFLSTEEPSVVAALNHAAKIINKNGGIHTHIDDNASLVKCQSLFRAENTEALDELQRYISQNNRECFEILATLHPNLERAGGGPRELSFQTLFDDITQSHFAVVLLCVDCVDAMGANIVNSYAERLADHLGARFDIEKVAAIVSNDASHAVVSAHCALPHDALEKDTSPENGKKIASAIQNISIVAENNVERAVTQNKGMMNGIDAFCLALGQDFRAVEAACHAFAARNGRYETWTRWRNDDMLHGKITLPALPLGVVGGYVSKSARIREMLRVCGINSKKEMQQVAAAVALAQNFAALRAIVTEGIHAGHMRLHRRIL